ncbi:hypothetical protein Sjap_023001 [Stephania japonica]|uniref:Uncharacterized protein n=1 Tax=Stephania japonica TaxID=461633 RepID=A0AAP0EQE4_9MAGN
MLIESSLPNSIEAVFSFASDHCKQDLSCDWMPSGETKQKCPKCEVCHWDQCRGCITYKEGKENVVDSKYLVHSKNQAKLSIDRNMCASPAPNLVYKRRKLQSNSLTLVCSEAAKSTKESGVSPSTMNSKSSLLFSEKDHLVTQIGNENCSVLAPALDADGCRKDTVSHTDLAINAGAHGENRLSGRSETKLVYFRKHDNAPIPKIKKAVLVETVSKLEPVRNFSGKERQLSDRRQNVGTLSKLEPIKNCSGREHKLSHETMNRKPGIIWNNLNDSCSSSKSNMKFGTSSQKTDKYEAGECSSSDILAREDETVSEKDRCISILRNYGLLEGALSVRSCASADSLARKNDDHQSLVCKTCGRSGNPLDMLICDNCEDAFHVSCCNPRIKSIPIDEWYCHPCSAKRPKLLQETAAAKSSNARNGVLECRSKTSKSRLNPIESMLKDPEPYVTGARIGKAFQAEVPEWSGPISDNSNYFDELLEMDPKECGCLYGLTTIKPSNKNSIGNWLQCQEVLDDDTGNEVEGTICGKWRRAPLFEVQTDDWDCSCAVLWDPLHSDCAVPQLRPRLAARKRKQNQSKNGTENIKRGTVP